MAAVERTVVIGKPIVAAVVGGEKNIQPAIVVDVDQRRIKYWQKVVGETILSLLVERDFPIDTLYAVDSVEATNGRVEFRDTYIQLQNIVDFDFSRVNLAFFCVEEEIAAQYVPKAVAAGCVVIDDSAQFRYQVDAA